MKTRLAAIGAADGAATAGEIVVVLVAAPVTAVLRWSMSS